MVMGEKSGSDILLDALPSLNKWRNIIVLYAAQLFIFIGVMAFFWWISIRVYYGAILGQLIVSILLVFHFIIMAKTAKKFRTNYKAKYGELAGERYWYVFQSYTFPIICAAYYLPLALKTDYFLPSLFKLPPHLINNSLFPIYVAIPLGLFVIIFGYLMKRPSGGYGPDVDNYLYCIYPEKSKLITGGMYRYVRNPQYLSRGIISIGFGIFANNISAMLVGLIHLLSYCAIIPAEDKELYNMYGGEFLKYKKEVPMVLPRFRNIGKVIKFTFFGEKQSKN